MISRHLLTDYQVLKTLHVCVRLHVRVYVCVLEHAGMQMQGHMDTSAQDNFPESVLAFRGGKPCCAAHSRLASPEASRLFCLCSHLAMGVWRL